VFIFASCCSALHSLLPQRCSGHILPRAAHTAPGSSPRSIDKRTPALTNNALKLSFACTPCLLMISHWWSCLAFAPSLSSRILSIVSQTAQSSLQQCLTTTTCRIYAILALWAAPAEQGSRSVRHVTSRLPYMSWTSQPLDDSLCTSIQQLLCHLSCCMSRRSGLAAACYMVSLGCVFRTPRSSRELLLLVQIALNTLHVASCCPVVAGRTRERPLAAL
jgi:hypothetical protein